MDPFTISLLAGAGMGLLKGESDKKASEADRKTQATIARYSPWTGMQPSKVKEADPMGSMLQGAMGGAQFGQGLAAQGQQAQILEAQKKLLEAQTAQANSSFAQPQAAAFESSPYAGMYRA